MIMMRRCFGLFMAWFDNPVDTMVVVAADNQGEAAGTAWAWAQQRSGNSPLGFVIRGEVPMPLTEPERFRETMIWATPMSDVNPIQGDEETNLLVDCHQLIKKIGHAFSCKGKMGGK